MNNCSRNQAAMPTIARDAERKNRRRDHETLCSVDRGSALGLTAAGADDNSDNRPAEHNLDHDKDNDNRPPRSASRDEASSPCHALWLPGASREASQDGQEDDDNHHHQELD
jgi:hypothetical protein